MEDSVRETSVDDFPPENYPPVHVERLVIRSGDLGVIEFQKIASRMRDGSGNWCVTLNVTWAERWESLWNAVEQAIEQHEIWSAYAVVYDEIIAYFDQNKALVSRVADGVGDAEYVLDIGAGTGSTAIALLDGLKSRRVRAVDPNYSMLQQLYKKVSEKEEDRNRIEIKHADCVAALADVEDESYDGCVMMNVLFAMDNPLPALKQIYRVLKYDAILSLSTSYETSNVEELFNAIRRYLVKRKVFANRSEAFELAKRCNEKMKGIITRYSVSQVLFFLREAGFQIDEETELETGLYVGCVLAVSARKLKVPYMELPEDAEQKSVVDEGKVADMALIE